MGNKKKPRRVTPPQGKPAKKEKEYSHRTPGGGAKGPIEINEKGVLRDLRKRQKEMDKIMEEN